MSTAVGSETLGHPVPPFNQHAIVVSLPAWKDNIGFRMEEKRVMNAMIAGYPRFFIPLIVRQLAAICEQKYAVDGEKCMLFPCKRNAEECQKFLLNQVAPSGTPAPIRLLQHSICPEDSPDEPRQCAELHIALFPDNLFRIAAQFWRYTGMGVSSRYAEYHLSLLPGQGKLARGLPGVSSATTDVTDHAGSTDSGQRSSLLSSGTLAKQVLRRRIVKLLTTGDVEDGPQGPHAGTQDANAPDTGVHDLCEDDVYLFPTGMVAIWNVHQLCLRALGPAKSVCFGFLYVDTLKVVEGWGPGVHFFGHGLDSDMDDLEKLLAEESRREPTKPPILALFTELPSNPLLWSPDMPRLRALADKYEFPLIIDDSIGNAVNVELLPYVDIIATSMSKIFSGAANAMGGSLVLNPQGRHYASFKTHMASYEDTYFDADALVMEYNSRDLPQRVRTIDQNAEALAAFLRSRSVAAGAPSAVIKEVFYPKYTSPARYLRCKRPDSGFGGLLSLTFTSLAASAAFYDALACYKGPSLGTNFTLACAYTILAFHTELEWAAQYGIEEGLVRVSVGMEERDWLLRSFETALKAAESVQEILD